MMAEGKVSLSLSERVCMRQCVKSRQGGDSTVCDTSSIARHKPSPGIFFPAGHLVTGETFGWLRH